jgi:uncharacterized protein (TIGR02145 family)
MANNKLKAYVRYDGTGRVISSSLILNRFKPKVGNWEEIDANQCCNPTTTTTTTSNPNCDDACWSTINFSGTTFTNGDLIPQALNATDWENASIAETPVWAYYNYDSANGPIYGKLYNWYVVDDPRGISPAGYHVPTETEWDDLITCLGGESVAAGKVKTTGTLEAGTGLWSAPNTGATNNATGCNECPLSVLPGGFINTTGISSGVNDNGFIWTSSLSGGGDPLGIEIYYDDATIYLGGTSKGYGYSIRLKKDDCA